MRCLCSVCRPHGHWLTDIYATGIYYEVSLEGIALVDNAIKSTLHNIFVIIVMILMVVI